MFIIGQSITFWNCANIILYLSRNNLKHKYFLNHFDHQLKHFYDIINGIIRTIIIVIVLKII